MKKIAEAQCGEVLTVEIRQLLKILAIRENENPTPPPPAVHINIVPADASGLPSASICATPTAVYIYVTGKITVHASGERRVQDLSGIKCL